MLALPEDVRVWVTERRPSGSVEAGQLAEDYRQARKLKQWEPNRKDMPKRCHACGKMGHIASDCGTPGKGGEKRNRPSATNGVEVKKKEPGIPGLTCYNCNGRGHTSRQCPSKVMYCGVRRRVNQKSSLRRQNLMRKGSVEGVFVDDILVDTGCSRRLVRRELVKPEKLVEGKSVEIQCAHGDTTPYPVAKVDLSVEGREITVEAAVSDTLPRSVLL